MTKVATINTSCDLSKLKFWQYTKAKNLLALLDNSQKFMDDNITPFINGLHTDILNIQTCNTFGLALWGQLLNTPRPTYTPAGESTPVEFDDEQYRLLLQARIYLLTFDGSVPSLVNFFRIMFPNTIIQVTDNLNMSATINVATQITDEIKAVFNYPGFIPRPSGVQYDVSFVTDFSKVFGFEGQTYTTESGTQESLPGFDNGTFYQ